MKSTIQSTKTANSTTEKSVTRVFKLKLLCKTYWKPFLLLFIIYLIGMFTLIRDQYYFTDDVPRSAIGYDYSADFNRFTSTTVVHLLQMSPFRLVSIAPFGQIAAAIFLALSSLMLVGLFSKEGKPSLKHPVPLVLSTFLGLSPFMFNAWQYQFESVWFTVAIFCAILPFSLYWHRLPNFKTAFGNTGRPTKFLHLDSNLVSFSKIFLVTLICNIAVWTSWQLATGIFLSLGLALIFRALIHKERLPIFGIITFILAYLFSTLFAYLTTIGMYAYVDTSMFPLANLIPGIFRNLGYSFLVFVRSLNTNWIILGSLSLLGLILSNRIRTTLLALGYLLLALPISLGPCLALEIYHIDARSLVGPVLTLTVFVLMMLPQLQLSLKLQKSPKHFTVLRRRLLPLFLAPSFMLLWSFTACGWAYGNALTDQYRYENYRIGLLVQDLAELYPTEDLSKYTVTLNGDAGLSFIMANYFHTYPVATFSFFGYSAFTEHDDSHNRFEYSFGRVQEMTFNYAPVNGGSAVFDCASEAEKFQTVRQNYYHTITDSRALRDPSFDPAESRSAVYDLDEEIREFYNLNKKDFLVCVYLTDTTPEYYKQGITRYSGQLVTTEFRPYNKILEK